MTPLQLSKSTHRRPNLHYQVQESATSDAGLMELIQARQQWALEELFNRYVTRGIRHARHTGVDYQTAEDIVTEAFIKIWNFPEKFQPLRGSFSAWFHRIVHNLAIDELRRMQARNHAHEKVYLQSEDSFRRGNDYGIQDLEQIQVRTALQSLPEAQQHLLQLAYFEGLSRREIAKRTGLPLGTVHTRVRLSKEKLKQLLQESTNISAFGTV